MAEENSEIPASSSGSMAEAMLLSLSLSVGVCIGLPTVIWAMYSLRRFQNAHATVSTFTIALMYSNILELLISPFVSTRLLEGTRCSHHLPCWPLYSALLVTRLCGLHFHQLVALEGILSLVYPTFSVSSRWSSVLSVAVWIFVITCHFFTIGYTIILIFCVVPVILAIITRVLIIRIPHSPYSLVRHKDPALTVGAISLVILLLLYLPCLVLICVAYPDPFYDFPWFTIPASIMSLRVVIEPLWCVLVCQEILKCQTHCSWVRFPDRAVNLRSSQ